MVVQQFVGGRQPQWQLDADAARLLVVLNQFAQEPSDETRALTCLPKPPFSRHFASEYYLQKLAFLFRQVGRGIR